MNKNNKCQDNEIKEMLKALGYDITKLQSIEKGNIKKISFFECNNREYVLSLSRSKNINLHNSFLSELLIQNNIPIKKLIKCGYHNQFYYTIHTKIAGEPLSSLSDSNLLKLLPDIAENLIKFHSIDISNTEGFGWIDENGQGVYASWHEFLQGFFHEKQSGYWENWFDLFECDILERGIFQDLYDTMMSLPKYCEGKRYLVHGDFHLENIITDGDKITGIIDWDQAMYGDFMFDIATLHGFLPEHNIAKMFKDYYEANNIEIPYFDECFKCVSLCKWLDGLRFFAKHRWKDSYHTVLDYLQTLLIS